MMDTIEKRSKNKTREQLAEMFIKSLDEQKLPWYAVWNTHPQQNAVSAKPYRGINAFLLSMVAAAFGYEDPRWCTFNQAKKKGWSIKKGAKGVPVEFWSAINIRTKEVMDFREAAQKIRDGEAEQGDFRYYNRNFHVFNAAQIEGMPELKRVTPTADIGLIRQNRDTLIKNMAVGFDGNGADCHYSLRRTRSLCRRRATSGILTAICAAFCTKPAMPRERPAGWGGALAPHGRNMQSRSCVRKSHRR